MNMPIIYVSHKFGGFGGNLDLAETWTAVLNVRLPQFLFISPWIATCRNYYGILKESDAIGQDTKHVKQCEAVLAILYGHESPSTGQCAEIAASRESISLRAGNYHDYLSQTGDARRALIECTIGRLSNKICSYLDNLD